MIAGEPDANSTTYDAATGALQPASFLQHAATLMSAATQTVTLVVIACEPQVELERMRNLVQRLTELGVVGKLGPRASLRVLASTQRATRLAALVVDQEQHLVARAVTAALAVATPQGFTAAVYARCVPTTFEQLRRDAEALLELALENGQGIETNQFADRAPPPAFNALAFRDSARDVGPHSVRGHALLFRFCLVHSISGQHAQPSHWIRVHTDGDLEFHATSDHGSMVAVPRLIEPAQLVAIADAWRSFICNAEALELCEATTLPSAHDGDAYWLEAFTHGTRGRATGIVRGTTAVAALLATISAAVAATRNA
jgi:hypothetical protein